MSEVQPLTAADADLVMAADVSFSSSRWIYAKSGPSQTTKFKNWENDRFGVFAIFMSPLPQIVRTMGT